MVKKEIDLQKKLEYDRMQKKIRDALGLWVSKRKLDSFSSMKWLLKDIYDKRKTKTDLRYLGWEDPALAPFYLEEYRAPTSHSRYNLELIKAGDKKIEYDFAQAYTVIMMNYKLPSNTYLKNVKWDTEKVIRDRIFSYKEKKPYADLDTFMIFEVELKGKAKKGTYAHPKAQGMLSRYGNNLNIIGKPLTEIELKILVDYYDIERFVVLDSHVFKCRRGMLAEYFERIEPLKTEPELQKLYKHMRTKVYGLIGQQKLSDSDKGFFNQPIYNRIFSAMVAGAFRDIMVRYEQKYVDSPYGLIAIVTDGIYFKTEVPEFERLLKTGAVKKKEHIITLEEEQEAKKRMASQEKENTVVVDKPKLRHTPELL